MKSRKSKQPLQSLTHFDIAKGSLLSNYHEVFNAWKQGESKISSWYLSIYNHLVRLFELSLQKPLTLQLIPVDQKQKGQFVIVNRAREYEL
jgi:hypothetical protein